MTRDQILQTAEKCVCGGRNSDYGEPERNFWKISELWSSYMGIIITEIDVAMMMVLLKAARVSTGRGTEDCFVDIAGYAACAGEMATLIKADDAQSAERTKESPGCVWKKRKEQ